MSYPKPELDVLIASIMYLMSRFGKNNDAGLIEAIQMHLKLLHDHPDLNSEVINKVCIQLQKHWSSINNLDCRRNSSTYSPTEDQNSFNLH